MPAVGAAGLVAPPWVEIAWVWTLLFKVAVTATESGVLPASAPMLAVPPTVARVVDSTTVVETAPPLAPATAAPSAMELTVRLVTAPSATAPETCRFDVPLTVTSAVLAMAMAVTAASLPASMSAPVALVLVATVTVMVAVALRLAADRAVLSKVMTALGWTKASEFSSAPRVNWLCSTLALEVAASVTAPVATMVPPVRSIAVPAPAKIAPAVISPSPAAAPPAVAVTVIARALKVPGNFTVSVFVTVRSRMVTGPVKVTVSPPAWPSMMRSTPARLSVFTTRSSREKIGSSLPPSSLLPRLTVRLVVGLAKVMRSKVSRGTVKPPGIGPGIG